MTSGGQTQDPTQVLWFKFHKVFLLWLTLCFMVFKLLSHTLILLIISNNPVKKIWAPFYGCENWVTGRVSKNWTARSFSLVSNLGPRQKKKEKGFFSKIPHCWFLNANLSPLHPRILRAFQVSSNERQYCYFCVKEKTSPGKGGKCRRDKKSLTFRFLSTVQSNMHLLFEAGKNLLKREIGTGALAPLWLRMPTRSLFFPD